MNTNNELKKITLNGFAKSGYFETYTASGEFELIPGETLNGATAYFIIYRPDYNILLVETTDKKIVFITNYFDFDNGYNVYNAVRKRDVNLINKYLLRNDGVNV